jgi:AraC-like DNA-binding protein
MLAPMNRSARRDTDYNAAVLSTNFLRLFCDALAQDGIDPAPFLTLANTQLRLQDLSDPEIRVSYRQMLGVVRHAVRRFPDRGLGLLLGAHVKQVSYGLLGMAMLAAARLEDALKLGIFAERDLVARLRQAEGEDASFPDIAKAIRRMLRQEPRHSLVMEDVALSLNMSVRTLRRRLDESGQSFREICNRARKDIAMELLSQHGMTNEQIAASTGFANTHSFYRAFKKWTGRAPGSFRK